MLLADQNRLTRIAFPWVTVALIALCTIGWLVELSGTPLPEALAFNTALLATPGDPVFWAGLFGHVFVHAGFMHLLGNMLALWVFGDNVEDAFGHLRFLGFFFATSSAGAIAYALTDGHASLLVGASGGIAGVMAGYLLLHPRARVALLALKGVPVSAPASWFVGCWLGGNLLHAMGNFDNPAEPNPIAWFAHLGGFAAGLALTIFARPADVALFQPGLAGDAEAHWFWSRVYHLGLRDGEDYSESWPAVGRALIFFVLVGLGLLFAI